jgi:hypothetical protein
VQRLTINLNDIIAEINPTSSRAATACEFIARDRKSVLTYSTAPPAIDKSFHSRLIRR